ncbi:MAG: serine/threonine protein kinase [Neolewinella sp.]|jgi:serine/threonine protein kinase
MFRANRTAYMVSDNETGRDLKWFLNTTDEALKKDLLYKIFLPILSSLNMLHKTGCLHLDIKPANILLRTNSEPLLLDFGASQDMASEKRINSIQTLTHGFAPPEQYDRKSDLGPWTDIYAVAATLYHAITNRPPAKSKDSDKESQLNVEIYSSLYSTQMLNAINQALLHDYGKRFQIVDDFAKELLGGSRWATLEDYEKREMGYNRNEENSTAPSFSSAA